MPVIKLAFLDVGQGDTTVITCPETQEAIVVDCVDSLSVLAYLEKEHIKQLRGVIITHLHTDHYAEVADLLNNCTDVVGTKGCEVLATTEEIIVLSQRRKRNVKAGEQENTENWMRDSDNHSEMYENQPSSDSSNLPLSPLATLHQWCQQHTERCEPIQATKHSSLPFTGTLANSLQLLHPPFIGYNKLKKVNLNNISVVLRVTGTGSSALLTGDLEPKGWNLLKEKYSILNSEVLKFPHHGGAWKEAEAEDLLSNIQPSIVVISVGSNNIYDHPRTNVFTSLRERDNLRVLCTQATNKCQQLVQNEQERVINQFQIQSKSTNMFFIAPRQQQCPCAGTVIIELDDEPRIIQPDSNFHESLINAHFRDHKCRISGFETSTTSSKVETTSQS